jgi:hypothetical protein
MFSVIGSASETSRFFDRLCPASVAGHVAAFRDNVLVFRLLRLGKLVPLLSAWARSAGQYGP